MKLASLKDGTRDGSLAVVATDLKRAMKASHIAPTLQAALDDWGYCAPLLDEAYRSLRDGTTSRAFDFDPREAMAPLARAVQFADGSSYLVHAELIRRSRGEEMPADAKREPLMCQGCSAPLLGACDEIAVQSEASGIDLEMELAVITGDVPMGEERDRAGEHIRLFMLMNDVSLRELVISDDFVTELARRVARHAVEIVDHGRDRPELIEQKVPVSTQENNNPEITTAKIQKGWLNLTQNNLPEARKWYDDFLAANAGHPWATFALTDLGRIDLKEGKEAEAYERFKQAYRADSSNKTPLIELKKIRAKEGRFGK